MFYIFIFCMHTKRSHSISSVNYGTSLRDQTYACTAIQIKIDLLNDYMAGQLTYKRRNKNGILVEAIPFTRSLYSRVPSPRKSLTLSHSLSFSPLCDILTLPSLARNLHHKEKGVEERWLQAPMVYEDCHVSNVAVPSSFLSSTKSRDKGKPVTYRDIHMVTEKGFCRSAMYIVRIVSVNTLWLRAFSI